MKITIGIDGSDGPATIRELIDGGADEFFAGYVPAEWSERYGWEVGLNRRTFGPDCQYTSYSDLAESVQEVHDRNREVFITFNAHQYIAAQVPMLKDIILSLEDLAVDGYIIADPGLALLLREWGVHTPLQLSTGAACFNNLTVRYFCGLGNVRRVVFPRKMTLTEMGKMVDTLGELGLEYEAMVLGYRCFFNDEYCFSWHSAGQKNFCSNFTTSETVTSRRFPSDWKKTFEEIKETPLSQFEEGSALDRFRKDIAVPPLKDLPNDVRDEQDEGTGISSVLAEALYMNCGLCSIARLKRIGISVVKIPARGDRKQKIYYLERVRKVIDHPNPSAEYCRSLINSPGFCARTGSCYYDLGGSED